MMMMMMKKRIWWEENYKSIYSCLNEWGGVVKLAFEKFWYFKIDVADTLERPDSLEKS